MVLRFTVHTIMIVQTNGTSIIAHARVKLKTWPHDASRILNHCQPNDSILEIYFQVTIFDQLSSLFVDFSLSLSEANLYQLKFWMQVVNDDVSLKMLIVLSWLVINEIMLFQRANVCTRKKTSSKSRLSSLSHDQ